MWWRAAILLAFGGFFGFKAIQGVRRGKMMARGGMVFRRERANWSKFFWLWVGLSAFVATVATGAGAYVLIFPSSP